MTHAPIFLQLPPPVLSEIKIPIVNEKMRTEPIFELFLTSSGADPGFPEVGD